MQRDSRTFLWDAVHALDSISTFARGRSFDDYDVDELLRSAVERTFEIIGEALNQMSKLDSELAGRVPGLRQIVGLRNVLIHGYALIDNAQVWQTINELSGLRAVLAALLVELDDQAPAQQS